MKLREVIKCIREREGLSRYAFGERLKTSSNRIKNWEEGVTTPGVDVIDNILEQFGYTFDLKKVE